METTITTLLQERHDAAIAAARAVYWAAVDAATKGTPVVDIDGVADAMGTLGITPAGMERDATDLRHIRETRASVDLEALEANIAAALEHHAEASRRLAAAKAAVAEAEAFGRQGTGKDDGARFRLQQGQAALRQVAALASTLRERGAPAEVLA